MAHVAKYKAAAVGHMMAHYRRDGRVSELRENIDETKTKDNYSFHVARGDDGKLEFFEGGSDADEVRRRVAEVEAASGRKVRKDAVILADMVVTAPPDVRREDLRKFFKVSYWYLAEQVGNENLLGAFVHMDEKTPHAHMPFTPVTTSAKGNPTFSYKKLCPRSFYQTFHSGLGDALEKELGYRPSVELSEEQREERVYTERTEDIDAMRAAVRSRVVEPAKSERDRLMREADELRGQVEELKRERSLADAEAAAAAQRLECLRRACDELSPVADELESAIAEARGFDGAARPRKREIVSYVRKRVARIADALGTARGLVSEAVKRLKRLSGNVFELRAREESRWLLRGLESAMGSVRGDGMPVPTRGEVEERGQVKHRTRGR